MSVRFTASTVIVRNAPAKLISDHALAGARATTVCNDGTLVAVGFAHESHRLIWIASLRDHGLRVEDIASDGGSPWIEVSSAGEAWVRGGDPGDLAEEKAIEHPPFQRLEVLSRSESGLHFVRERKSGILRQLTEEELRDFDDPKPCEECGEQFGCEHYNCAGERMLEETEVDAEVPEEWRRFARAAGVSRRDIERLKTIGLRDGRYTVAENASSDMRTMEIVLLLNGDATS